MALSGNKGEWSEIYTLFKTLSEGRLYSGDASLNRIEDLFYPIIKVLRKEAQGNYEYIIDNDIVLVVGGENEIRIPVTSFANYASILFREIRSARATFSLPEVEEFMTSIHCRSLKAKSADKTDIRIVIHDLRTGLQPLLGFSIKSKLGRPSTLLNAGRDNTNFVYKITGLTNVQIDEINNIEKFQEKFGKIRQYNGQISFIKSASELVDSNLTYVDEGLPSLIGNIILLYYSTDNRTIRDIINVINADNPRNYNYSFNQDFYEHKIKRFLTDVALGLKMSRPWTGRYEANGGYLIVKEDGDVICYHIYDKAIFEDYLFNNTRLETPSTSRHEFGTIYQEGDQHLLKLNLQIRFI